MQITVDFKVLIEIATLLVLTGGAVWWAFRRVEDLKKSALLYSIVLGDPEADDPKKRAGLLGRVEKLEERE